MKAITHLETAYNELKDLCCVDGNAAVAHREIYLAMEALKGEIESIIKDAWELGAAHGTAEDDVLPEAVERQREFIKELEEDQSQWIAEEYPQEMTPPQEIKDDPNNPENRYYSYGGAYAADMMAYPHQLKTTKMTNW